MIMSRDGGGGARRLDPGLQANVELCSEVKDGDFSDMAEAEAKRAAEAERLREEALEQAREMEQRASEEKLPSVAQQMARKALWHRGRARILDFDPKREGTYYNRCYYVDHATFDHDEESPLGPSRYTDPSNPRAKFFIPGGSVNIFSLKIVSLDVGFPIHVYGTLIARDCLDKKCVYLFRRDRDNCQVIDSEDESLILTGPKRGLAVVNDIYVETDLKVKDYGGQDRQLSKGILYIDSIARRMLECKVESRSLATRLSMVEMVYGVVRRAVEAAMAIEVGRGDFDGEITAYTTSIQNRFVLYDSKVAGDMTYDGNGVIQLMRPVISVYLEDMLIVAAKTADGKCEHKFTPAVNGEDYNDIIVGATEMRMKVTWSLIHA